MAALTIASLLVAGCTTPRQIEHATGTWESEFAFSPAVVTQGGQIIWVAGHGSVQDANGVSLEGNFDGQVRASFAELQKTLAREGAALGDIVSMTVYITDARLSRRFTEIRKEYYPDGKYPASALVTVAGLALPGMMVEIQPVVVLQEKRRGSASRSSAS